VGLVDTILAAAAAGFKMGLPDAYALLSRFHVIDVEGPTETQFQQIAESVNQELLTESEWSSGFDGALDSKVVESLRAMSPRVLRRALEYAYARAAAAGRRSIAATDLDGFNAPRRKTGIGFVQ
jgi:hypothetical protein